MRTLDHFSARTERKDLGVVVVTHLLDTSVPFLDALARSFEVAAVIPIPYSLDTDVQGELEGRYRIVVPDGLGDIAVLARAEVERASSRYRHVALQEIGGYCASDTPFYASVPNFVGIVEDTKNGHWRYLAAADLAVLIVSLADSPLKSLENHQVGRTVATRSWACPGHGRSTRTTLTLSATA